MIPTNNQAQATRRVQYPSMAWSIDHAQERMARTIDGLNAMTQAVKKILTTERYSEEIYGTEYGVELHKMIGRSKEYLRSALPLEIRTALMQDDRITSVSTKIVETTTDSITFVVDVMTRLGSLSITHKSVG